MLDKLSNASAAVSDADRNASPTKVVNSKISDPGTMLASQAYPRRRHSRAVYLRSAVRLAMASVPAAVPKAAVPANTGSLRPLIAALPSELKLSALTCIPRSPRALALLLRGETLLSRGRDALRRLEAGGEVLRGSRTATLWLRKALAPRADIAATRSMSLRFGQFKVLF